MVSNDNFVTVDVFEARMDRLEAVFEKYIAVMRQENAEFRAQMKDDMAAFKDEVRNDMKTFKNEVKEDISTLENKMNSGFEKVHAEIGVLQRDVEGLKHDVTGLYHWNYWLLSIILVVFAMPQIIAGIKSFFGAITEGIAGILTLFRQEKKIS